MIFYCIDYTWSSFLRPALLYNVLLLYRGPAPFHRLTPNKRFEPVFSTVIMAVCSLFNRMLLLTYLIPVHLVYCGQTVMIGCNHTSFEWTRAVRHIYGIIRHMQGLYWLYGVAYILGKNNIIVKHLRLKMWIFHDTLGMKIHFFLLLLIWVRKAFCNLGGIHF